MHSLLFVITIFIVTNILYTWATSAGSAIFYNRFARRGCWNEEDTAKLRARRLFEHLVPSAVNPDRINSRYIRDSLRYFREALSIVSNDLNNQTAVILKEALADTIGAHLRSEILPTARFAYYAGYVPYVKVRELHDFYNNLKLTLNTQGLGWRKPEGIPQWSNLTVAKIVIGDGKYFDPCRCLILKRDASSCMHMSLPQLDDELEPTALALPLRSGGFVSLRSPVSENILLKYYTTVSRCILNSSPAQCRHTDFVNFNNDMWHWMKRNVAPHLADEHLYAAYGGVLRIAAAVQSYGKGLSRRNLFDVQYSDATKWHPWKTFTDTYIYINTDWTPHLYVGIVVLAAISICLLQMCVNLVLCDRDACTCNDRPFRPLSKDVAYAAIESNIPAMLPTHQSAVFYSEQQRAGRARAQPMTSSLRSFRTQKVYDLNENTEKLMSVIMSDKEDSEDGGTVVKDDVKSAASVGKRSASPPKIHADTSQLRLPKCGNEPSHFPLYSTSTVTRSALTFRQPGSDSWSATSTSDRSLSSTTSKSRCLRSRWLRRAASKHSDTLQRKSTSGTEIDYTSFTTPPSRR